MKGDWIFRKGGSKSKKVPNFSKFFSPFRIPQFPPPMPFSSFPSSLLTPHPLLLIPTSFSILPHLLLSSMLSSSTYFLLSSSNFSLFSTFLSFLSSFSSFLLIFLSHAFSLLHSYLITPPISPIPPKSTKKSLRKVPNFNLSSFPLFHSSSSSFHLLSLLSSSSLSFFNQGYPIPSKRTSPRFTDDVAMFSHLSTLPLPTRFDVALK